jgi:hypothetical protein
MALLPLLVLSAQAFGQSSAALSGTVADSSGGVLPNTNITVVNADTGVESKATTNNVGIYNFPSLQPGTYRVIAQVSGFQTSTKTDVRLRVGSRLSLNFDMVVAGGSEEVEVTATAENMVLEAGASTGTVMQEELVAELPLVGNNVMELLNTMGGVIKAEEPIFSAATQTFAGVASGAINITRDGVSANEVRYTSGITPPSNINQEVVGEFKMILSPVDAELGRGAGQVQITTKSGGNAYHGSAVWNNQNTALDARKFEDKRVGTTPPWRNVNNYTLSASGPIIKNKTFFFVSWDQQIVRSKEWVTANVLTNCARNGIYRYYDGIVGINPTDQTNYNLANGAGFPHAVVVKSAYDGTPELGALPAGVTGTPQLMAQSLFGAGLNISQTDLMNDCKDISALTPGSRGGITGAGWDATGNRWDPTHVRPDYRNSFDSTGYVAKYTDWSAGMMPKPNYFGVGDGLNIAAIQWWRATAGSANSFGVGEDNRRRQLTVKLDHNINSSHRLSGTYLIEKNEGEDGGPVWPENSYIGMNERKPQNVTLSLTSTIAPTVLNEFRFGFSRLTGYVNSSIDASDGKLEPLLKQLSSGIDLPYYNSDRPIVVNYDQLTFGPGASTLITGGISSPFASRGVMNNTWGGTDHRWTAADTVTWMKGAHSFKGGFEVRLSKAWYTSDGEGGLFGTSAVAPLISGGSSSAIAPLTRNDWMWPGISTYMSDPDGDGPLPSMPTSGLSSANGSNSNQGTNVNNILNFLAGTVTDVRQYYFISKNGSNIGWNDINAGQDQYITDIRSRELSFFFKDDWKLTSALTLNLGVRYEYYGVPWNATGMTMALRGGSSSILGQAGSTWMDWLGLSADPTTTEYEFVGPGSDHSDRSVWNKDKNNFGEC